MGKQSKMPQTKTFSPPAMRPKDVSRFGQFSLSPGYDFVGNHRVFINAHGYDAVTNPVQLRALVFKPALAEGDTWKCPTVVLHTPYRVGNGGGDWTYIQSINGAYWAVKGQPGTDLINDLVGRGYAVMFVDQRGTGDSGGYFDFWGPDTQKDGLAIEAWIKAQAWSNGKVGAIGLSGPANTALANACAGAFDAVIYAASINGQWLSTYWDAVPWTANYDVVEGVYYYTFLQSMGLDVDTYLSLNQRVAGVEPVLVQHFLNVQGDLTDYLLARQMRPLVPNIKAAMLVCQNERDTLLIQNGFWDGFWEAIPSPKKLMMLASATYAELANHRWPRSLHNLPDITPMFERNDWHEMFLAWFDQYLLGIDNNCASWPPVQLQTEVLYAGPPVAGKNDDGTTKGPDPITGAPNDDGVYKNYNGDRVTTRWVEVESPSAMGVLQDWYLDAGQLTKSKSLVKPTTFSEALGYAWSTTAFKDPFRLSGHAELDLWIAINKTDAHFMAHLEIVRPDNSVRRIMPYDAALSAQHRNGFRPADVAPVPLNTPQRYRVRFPWLNQWIRPGEKLRLVLSGVGRPVPERNFQAMEKRQPAGTDYTATVFNSDTMRSRLILPRGVDDDGLIGLAVKRGDDSISPADDVHLPIVTVL